MNVELIGALAAFITAVASVITAVLMNRKTTALMEYRLKKVEEKLEVHNGYAEKLGGIAVTLAEIQKDISYLREK